MCSEGKPMNGAIIKKLSLYDEMTVTSAHHLMASCEILKNQQVKDMLKWNTAPIGCAAPV